MSNDGGPAFPIFNVHQPWNNDERKYDGVETEVTSSGISLRDWFAGQALNGIVSAAAGTDNHEAWAVMAYRFADAMLAARSKS